MKRCRVCVLPESFPEISFDSEGICSVCNKFNEEKAFIPSMEKLNGRLNEIINDCKAKRGRYDAVVAYSGGKDSTFLLYTLIKKYNLKLLAVTFDNGFMSKSSFINMENVLNNLNVDHIVVKPKLDLMKKIFYESTAFNVYPEHLTKFGSGICISCIRMVSNTVLRIAVEKQIPMVMMGNTPGQLLKSENEIIFQDNKIPYELRKRLFKALADKVGEEVYYYLMLSKEEYKKDPFPYTINAFPLIGYDEETIYNTIKELGWKRPSDVDPNSTNCRLNSLGIVKHLENYRFHPYDFEMSMLVRLGIINREEALKRVMDPEEIALKLSKQVEEMIVP